MASELARASLRARSDEAAGLAAKEREREERTRLALRTMRDRRAERERSKRRWEGVLEEERNERRWRREETKEREEQVRGSMHAAAKQDGKERGQ